MRSHYRIAVAAFVSLLFFGGLLYLFTGGDLAAMTFVSVVLVLAVVFSAGMALLWGWAMDDA